MFDIANADVPTKKSELFDRLMRSNGREAFVLGRNKYAESVALKLDVAGFVDDTTDDSDFLGKPIVRMADLPRDCLVVSCVVDARPVTAMRRLRENGIDEALDYFSLLRLSDGQFRRLDYSEHVDEDLRVNRTKYEWLNSRLSDERSRETLRNIIRFRLTGNLDYMTGFTVQLAGQYFEPFVRFGEDAVFVDGGGFDGGTTLGFVKRCPAYRRIYYFEPNPRMMRESERILESVRAVTFFREALSNSAGHVRFDADEASASHISEDGAVIVPTARLDDVVTEPVTFLKLDIEGAEYDALDGARMRISADRPTMAICVYHDQRDFWRIPERILSYVSDYSIFLRHYTEGILETVMYFVPPESQNV